MSDLVPEPPYDQASSGSLENTKLSTWIPDAGNFELGTEKAISIRLRPDEKLTFVGQYDIWVKTGVVKLYGALLRGGRANYRVFAPSTSALPSIICSPEGPADIEIWQSSHTWRPFSKLSPLFRRIWNEGTINIGEEVSNQSALNALLSKSSFSYLRIPANDAGKRLLVPLEVSREWEDTIHKLSSPLVVGRVTKALICGPQGSGKSTFCRLLVNRLVTSLAGKAGKSSTEPQTVCWLDLDPGQPEFTTPGQISLIHVRNPIFGPPFTHPYAHESTSFRLMRAHCLPALSPREDPVHFLDCAKDLLSHYEILRNTFPACSLIVNCPGWVRSGSAVEVLTQLFTLSAATDLVFMAAPVWQDIVEGLAESAGMIPVHRLAVPVRPYTLPARTAPELREMQTISYFHQLEPLGGELRWSPARLSRRPSWNLNYTATQPDLLGVLTLGEQPKPEFLPTVLLGTFVAICIVGDDDTVAKAASLVAHTNAENLPYWPYLASGLGLELPPGKLSMIGLALVQNIDVEKEQLWLQTPLSEVTLRKHMSKTKDGKPRLILVRGNWGTPGWAYLEEVYVPYKQQQASGQKRIGKNTTTQDEEDLRINTSGLGRYDDPEGEEDAAVIDVPWVTRAVQGKGIGQRWRVRKDIGRPQMRNMPAASSGPAIKSRIRSQLT